MGMTAKHFELIAEAIRVERPSKIAMAAERRTGARNLQSRDFTLDRVADNLAAQLKMINPRFDEARFLEATRA